MKLKKYSCNVEQEEFGPGNLGYPVTLLLAIKSFIGMIFHISNFIPYFSKNNSLNRERKNNLEEAASTAYIMLRHGQIYYIAVNWDCWQLLRCVSLEIHF